MIVQAALVGIAIAFLAGFGGSGARWTGGGLGTATLIVPLLLNVTYARALAGRKRSDGRARSDRRVAIGILLTVVAPTVYAIVAIAEPKARISSATLDGHAISTFVAIVSAGTLAIVFLSSTVDWYVIRPWRDGVVTDRPPCCRSAADRQLWLNVTRLWLHHRIVAAVAVLIALWVVVGLVWFQLAKHHANSDWAIYLLGLASPAAVPLFAMRSYVSGLAVAIPQAWGNLYIALGDTVEWTEDGVTYTGVAYDVAIDAGYRVIDPNGRSHRLALPKLKGRQVTVNEGEAPGWACDAVCKSGLDRACDFREPRVRPSWRWLVV